MAFKDDIEDYIGTFTDTTALSLWLNRGAQFILMRLPDSAVRHLAVPETVPVGGLSIYGKRVLEAHALYYKSKEYPAGMKARLADSGSIYKATGTSPAHIIDNTKLFIYPSGGTAIIVTLPTGILYSDIAMTSVPLDLVHGIILYAAIQGQIFKINALDIGGITLSFPTIPTTPTAPNITFAAVSPTAISATTIGSLGTAPAYSTTLPAVPTFDLGIIGTPPTALGAPSFAYTEAVESVINITKVIDLASAFTSVDTYIDTSRDFELAEAKINEIQAKIQEFIAESNLALQEATKNAEIAVDTDLKNSLQLLAAQIQEYTAKVERYSAELNKYQIDKNSKRDEYQLTLNAWVTNTNSIISDAWNSFQEENVPYQASLQKVIAQAQLDQQRLIQIAANTDNINLQNEARELEQQMAQYRFTLEKFASDLQSYNMQVNGEVSRVNLLLSKYNSQYTQMQGVLASLRTEFDNFLNFYGIK